MSEEAKVLDQEEQQEDQFEGLDEKEVEAAKEHGLIEKEEEKEEEAEKEDVEDVEGKKEEVVDDKPSDPANFEEMDESYSKDQDNFHKKFTSNAKALYFKHKRNKQLRQEAQERADKAEQDRDHLAIKEKVYEKKIDQINELLDKIEKGDENLTTADIRKVTALKEEADEVKKEIEDEKGEKKPSKEEEEKHAKYLEEKVTNTEILGKSNYEDFERYVNLANEVVAKDKDFAVVLTRAFNDPEVDEAQLVEKIVKFAKVHPDFNKKSEEDKKENTKIDRMVANSKKKKTSASLTAGSGKMESGYDDMTAEDLARMDQEEFGKVPKDVRNKILRKTS